jgi:hypothetical protein
MYNKKVRICGLFCYRVIQIARYHIINLKYSKLMQVKDLTVEDLKLLIQETVAETIESLLNDPDEGRQIDPEVKQELLYSLQKTQSGERGISAAEVAKQLGLNW